MQVGPILDRLDPSQRATLRIFALAVLATVIVVRIVWVHGLQWRRCASTISRRGFNPPRPMLRPSVGSGLVSCRGPACAASSRSPRLSRCRRTFPYRDLILLSAFCVVLGTLAIQGLTLRPLIERLKFDEYDPVAHEVAQARVAAYRAALATLDGDSSDEAKLLRKELSRLLAQAEGPGRHVVRRSAQFAPIARHRGRAAHDIRVADERRNRRRRLSRVGGRVRLGGDERRRAGEVRGTYGAEYHRLHHVYPARRGRLAGERRNHSIS